MSEPIAPVAPSERQGMTRRWAANGLAMAMAVGAVFLVHFWEKQPPADSVLGDATAKLIAAANKCSCVILDAIGHECDAEGRVLYLYKTGRNGMSVEVLDNGSPMAQAMLLTAMLTLGSIVVMRTWEAGRKREGAIFLISLVLTIPLLVFFAGVFQAVGIVVAIRRQDFVLEVVRIAACASLFVAAAVVAGLWLLTKDLVRETPHVQFAPVPDRAILARPPLLWAAMAAVGTLLVMLVVRVPGVFAREEWWSGSYGFRMLIGAACAGAGWALLNLVLLRVRSAANWVLPVLLGLAVVSDLAMTASLAFVLAVLALYDERTAVVCGREVDGESYMRIHRRATRPLTTLAWVLALAAAAGATAAVLHKTAAIDLPYLDTLAKAVIGVPLALVGAAVAMWERRDLRRLQLSRGISQAGAALLAIAAAVVIAALALIP